MGRGHRAIQTLEQSNTIQQTSGTLQLSKRQQRKAQHERMRVRGFEHWEWRKMSSPAVPKGDPKAYMVLQLV